MGSLNGTYRNECVWKTSLYATDIESDLHLIFLTVQWCSTACLNTWISPWFVCSQTEIRLPALIFRFKCSWLLQSVPGECSYAICSSVAMLKMEGVQQARVCSVSTLLCALGKPVGPASPMKGFTKGIIAGMSQFQAPSIVWELLMSSELGTLGDNTLGTEQGHIPTRGFTVAQVTWEQHCLMGTRGHMPQVYHSH